MVWLKQGPTVAQAGAHLPRVLLGVLFVLPGSVKLAVPFEVLGPSYGFGQPFMASLHATGYFFILLALTQLTAVLVFNRVVPLALTLLAPIIVNILLFHVFLHSSLRGWLMTGLVLGLELLLVYRYRRVFEPRVLL